MSIVQVVWPDYSKFQQQWGFLPKPEKSDLKQPVKEFQCQKSKEKIPPFDPVWFNTEGKCNWYNKVFLNDQTLSRFIQEFVSSSQDVMEEKYFYRRMTKSKKNEIGTWLLAEPAETRVLPISSRINAFLRRTKSGLIVATKTMPLNVQVTTKNSFFDSSSAMTSQINALSLFLKFIVTHPQFKRYFINVFDIVVQETQISQIMETMEGDGINFVKKYRRDPRYFSYAEAIVQQLAIGILALRSAGLHLQDIKPQNFVYSFYKLKKNGAKEIIAKWIDLDCVTFETKDITQCITEGYHDIFTIAATTGQDYVYVPSDLPNLAMIIYYLFMGQELTTAMGGIGVMLGRHGPRKLLMLMEEMRKSQDMPDYLKWFVRGTLGPINTRLSLTELIPLITSKTLPLKTQNAIIQGEEDAKRMFDSEDMEEDDDEESEWSEASEEED